MSIKSTLLKMALIGGLSFIGPKTGPELNDVNVLNFNNLIAKNVEETKIPEINYYFSPFKNIKDKSILPYEDSAKVRINEKAKDFSEKTLEEARKIYEKEKKAREENKDLLSLIQEYNSELRNPEKAYERMRLNKMRGISLENSSWVEGKKVYTPEESIYKNQVENLCDSLEYFGGAFLFEDHLFYNPEKAKNFIKKGLKPIDCTSFVLEALSRGQNKNYYKTDLSRAYQIAQMLNKKGFEGIYLAENTSDTSSTYKYGVRKQFHTQDFVRKIKSKNYEFPIDYLITDSSLQNPLFKKFLEESSGFVFLQEGVHLGFLDRGQFIDAHITADPTLTPVFSSRKFYDLIDNNNPQADYQSAVICLPKGSVNKFLYENKERIKN